MAEPQSAVVDGRVDTSGLGRSKAVAAGRERPEVDQNDAGFEPVEDKQEDLTQDPSWAAFQKAHEGNFNLPPSQTQRDDADLVSKLPPELAVLLQKVPATTKPAQATQGQAAPTAPAKDATKTTDTAESVEKRTNAIAALKRDGWTDTMIQKFSDAELLEVGLKRHDSQKTIDAKLDERRQALRETAKPSDTKTPESGATPASDGPGPIAPPTFEVALKEAAAGISTQFTEQFGEDVGKPVGVAMESAFKKFAAPLLQQNEALLRGLQNLGRFLEESVASDVRRSWKDEYPATADDKTWAEINTAYDRLAATGEYQGRTGAVEAWEHARRIVLPGAQPVSAAQHSAQLDQVNAQKAAGTLTIGARAPANGVKSEESQEFEAFLRAHQISEQLRAGHGVGAV